MNSPRFESLEAALASLPREVAPARDLWPQVEQAIAAGNESGGARTGARTGARALRVARMPWPMALAASVLLASLTGALCWSVARDRAQAELLAQRTPASGAASIPVSFQPPQDADYVAARAALMRTFNERLDLLAPATRARVRADLDTIRKANADISAALAQDPASPLLWQLLRNTWQQEINLYTSVAQTTQSMLTRSSRS